MALVLKDRVKEQSTTTGTGSFTLTGAYDGFQTFSAAIASGSVVYYCIHNTSSGVSTEWEVGVGTFTSPSTLSRDTILESSNSGSAVDFSAGTKEVFVTYPAEKSVNLDTSGNVTPLGTVASGTWQGTTIGLGYGGTGQTSAQAAINALAGAVTSGQYLRGNGTNVVMSAIQAADVPTLNQNTTGSAGSVANALTMNNSGTGAASGTTFNGSAAQTISYNTIGASPLAGSSSLTTTGTVTSGTWSASFGAVSGANLTNLTAGNLSGTIPSGVLGNSTAYVGTTAVALNRASANQALTGISSVTLPGATSGTVQIIPAATAGTGTVFTLPATTGTAITSGDTGTVTNTMLAGSIANNKLTNSSVTINGSAVSLGGSITVTATATNALTISSPLSGTSYNGSSAVSIGLASGYGDTQNPYASKTANYFLAAPNGTAGVPTFRAIVAADIPTLNQNTTGSSGSCTGNAATATSSPKVSTSDLRSTALTPSYFGQGLNTAFMANSTDGLNDGGSYHGIIQFQQWTDATGGGAAEIAITDNNNIWHRGSSGGLTTWSTWYKFLDSGNYNSYSPTLTGTGASGTWGINITGDAATVDGKSFGTFSAAGGIIYATSTTAASGTAAGTAGQLLQSAAAGAPTWISPTDVAFFPAGTVMLFRQTAAPTGWTKDTTNYNDSALRVVTGTISSGGTVGFTTAFASQAVSGSIGNTTATGSISISGGSVSATTLAESQIPSHSHNIGGNWASIYFRDSPYQPGMRQETATATTGGTGGGGSHTHGFTNPTGSFTGTAHNHTFTGTAINLAVKYCDVIFATKN